MELIETDHTAAVQIASNVSEQVEGGLHICTERLQWAVAASAISLPRNCPAVQISVQVVLSWSWRTVTFLTGKIAYEYGHIVVRT